MPVREKIQVGDPRLKARNKSVDNFGDPIVKQVVNNLIDSMIAIIFSNHIADDKNNRAPKREEEIADSGG